jgi:hypothetical protein
MEPPSFMIGKCFLHREIGPARIDVENLVEMLGRGGNGRHHLHDASIGDDYIDSLLLVGNRLIKAVEIGEICYVALDGYDILVDFLGCLIELPLAAANDEHIGALSNETLGDGKSDAAAATRDDGDFLFKFLHGCAPSMLKTTRSVSFGLKRQFVLLQHLVDRPLVVAVGAVVHVSDDALG